MTKSRIKILGLLGFIIICVCCLIFKVAVIENDLSLKTDELIKSMNLSDISFKIDGRDVSLTGNVETESIKSEIEKAASEIYGVANINNLIEVQPKLPPKPEKPVEKSIEEKGAFFNSVNIEFETGSDIINEKSYSLLDEVASYLNNNPNLTLEVSGHTDSKGSESLNINLSQRRAAAIKEYLVSKGIQRSRLTAIGLGSSKPVASNSTRMGRQQNRRVEFKFLEEK